MSFTQFTVYGPYPIPLSCRYRFHGYWRVREGARSFWADAEAKALQDRKGCYAFGVRTGGGITLTYVGLTVVQTFGKECFTKHKVSEHYNPALRRRKRKKGTPVLYFVVAPRGKTPSLRIPQVESFLIQTCVTNGIEVTNQRKRGEYAWGIGGISPRARGRPADPAAGLRKALRI